MRILGSVRVVTSVLLVLRAACRSVAPILARGNPRARVPHRAVSLAFMSPLGWTLGQPPWALSHAAPADEKTSAAPLTRGRREGSSHETLPVAVDGDGVRRRLCRRRRRQDAG